MKIEIPDPHKKHLRLGTCSWKYDSWKGLYYDSARKYRADDYLADYSYWLNSVEVDQWFWSLFPGGVRLPEPTTVKTYAESVPDDFVFTVKAPNSITLTHYYSRQPKNYKEFAGRQNEHFLDNGLLERFLELLAPFGKKLGPVMFQFEYLNKNKMPSREVFLERFGEFIDRAPAGFEYALECRNPNYFSPALFEFMGNHKIGFVYLEGYYMPPIGDVFEKYRPATSDSCVIRLHGGDRSEIEKETGEVWSRIVAPKPEGIEAAAKIVAENTEKGTRTFLNVNNHYEGSAPLTIERFLEVLAR